MQIRLLVHTLMGQEAPSHSDWGGGFRGLGLFEFHQTFGSKEEGYQKALYTKSQPYNSKRWKVISQRKSISLYWFFFSFFGGLGWSDFFSKFRIQSRMILVNSVPNPKSIAPKLQKLSHRKVPINVGRQTSTSTTIPIR